jgi:hypothetical protein
MGDTPGVVRDFVRGAWERENYNRVIHLRAEEETPVRELYCATCRTETTFEAPPCEDVHDDCPELLCTGCGGAIVIAPVTVVRAWLRPRNGHIAPHQRRAA